MFSKTFVKVMAALGMITIAICLVNLHLDYKWNRCGTKEVAEPKLVNSFGQGMSLIHFGDIEEWPGKNQDKRIDKVLTPCNGQYLILWYQEGTDPIDVLPYFNYYRQAVERVYQNEVETWSMKNPGKEILSIIPESVEYYLIIWTNKNISILPTHKGAENVD